MAEPFLRWAGGKRWLADGLAPRIRSRLGGAATFYEPFLGSGAMFFAVQPARAALSDINPELIGAFRQVKASAGSLKNLLATFPATKREYLRIRSWKTDDAVERAVRFLFLNRNCWGGLWRENRQGIFNVPYGGGERNHRKLVDTTLLRDASRVLRSGSVELRIADFEVPLARAKAGDVVYCDPTYRRRTRQHFDRYGATLFGWEDQERLAAAAIAASARGALVIVSNASCFGVRELYSDALILEVSRRKGLGPGDASATLAEYVFILDPTAQWGDWTTLGKVIGRSSGMRVVRNSRNAGRAQRLTGSAARRG